MIKDGFLPLFCRSGEDQEVLFDQILMGQVDFPSPYWDNVSDSAKVDLQNLYRSFSCLLSYPEAPMTLLRVQTWNMFIYSITNFL